MGTAIPYSSVCWHAEFVVRVSGLGLTVKTRAANVRRIPESERWFADRVLGMRVVPWSPGAFNIQVGMARPAEVVPRSPGEMKLARTYVRIADFERWGLSEGCPECRYLKGSGATASSQRSMS